MQVLSYYLNFIRLFPEKVEWKEAHSRGLPCPLYCPVLQSPKDIPEVQGTLHCGVDWVTRSCWRRGKLTKIGQNHLRKEQLSWYKLVLHNQSIHLPEFSVSHPTPFQRVPVPEEKDLEGHCRRLEGHFHKFPSSCISQDATHIHLACETECGDYFSVWK